MTEVRLNAWRTNIRKLSGRLFPVLACVLVALALTGETADAAPISGTVHGQIGGDEPSPVANASVQVLDADGIVVASAVTDMAGHYSADAPDASFDVRFDPPPASLYGSVTIEDVDLSSARTLDLVLVPASAVRLSGVLRDAQGVGIGGREVRLSTALGGDEFRARTAADGSYSVAVEPGDYVARVFSIGPQGFPYEWELMTARVSVHQSRTFDIDVPATADLTVRVLDSDGSPLAGAQVSMPGLTSSDNFEFGQPWLMGHPGLGTTNAAGEVTLTAFNGTGPRPNDLGTIHPPTTSDYTTTTFSIPEIDGDTTIVVKFETTDVAPPNITCDPGDDSWHDANVSVVCTAEDGGSGLANASDSEFELATSVPDGTEDGDASTSSRQVCDMASNCRTAGPVTGLKVDRKAPTLEIQYQPDGQDGWFISAPAPVSVRASDVSMDSLNCSLDGSPAGTLEPNAATQQRSIAIDVVGEGSHELSCDAVDSVGHSTPAASSITIDTTPPSLSLVCPVDPRIGSIANAFWQASDGGSGLIGPVTGFEPLATSLVGLRTASHVARDNAGLARTASCTYRVVYPFSLRDPSSPPNFNKLSGNRPTSTVSFSLGGDRGLAIYRSGYPMTQPVDCADGSAVGTAQAAVASSPLRYNANQAAYHYTWDPRATTSQGCVALLLGLNDGTTQEIWFRR